MIQENTTVRNIAEGVMSSRLSSTATGLYMGVSERLGRDRRGLSSSGEVPPHTEHLFNAALEHLVELSQHIVMFKLEGGAHERCANLYELLTVLRKLLDLHVSELLEHAPYNYSQVDCPLDFEKGTLGEALDSVGLLK